MTDRGERIESSSLLQSSTSHLPSSILDPRPSCSAIDVSVCIVNWNCKDVLRDCLKSLHSHDQAIRLEIIVVDNGSTDGAAHMVAREFPDVLLLRNSSNRGFARANNQAAERARGRYLFFLNNDTLVPPGALRRLVQYADTHPEVGLIGPQLRDAGGRAQASYRQRPTLQALLHRTNPIRLTGLCARAYREFRRQEEHSQAPREVEVLMGAAMLIPRRVFSACGPWDEEFVFGGEDLELSDRIGKNYRLIYLPGVTITHLGRMSTRQHIGYAYTHMLIGFLRYLRKAGYRAPALWVYKFLVTLDVPIQFVWKSCQYAYRRARGQRARAEKTQLVLRSLEDFFRRGLVEFWRA